MDQQRNLGEFKIPPLVFGGNVFGWTADKKTSFRLLDALMDRGLNYIDTADVYSYWAEGNSGGESERVLGEWMQARKNRDRVIIATKVGSPMGKGSPDLSIPNIQDHLEASLKRLQTDYIDVYYSHKYDDTVAQTDTLSAYNHAIQQGKVRSIGASNFPLAVLREAIQISEKQNLPRYEFIQPEYNLMEREAFEGDYQDFCMKNKLKVNSYFTLASGFLTGKYADAEDASGKERERFVKKYFDARGKRVLGALQEISKKHRVSQAAVSIAWTMNQPGITAPIVSATRESHIKSFDEALKFQLDTEDLDRLNRVSLKEKTEF